MKKIENKVTSLMLTENEKVSYADLLVSVVNAPIKEGISLKQMKSDLALLGKVEELKSNPDVEFTTEEISAIKSALEKHLWGARHPELAIFGDYIESL